jgi:NAD(P)-dependent dehydrogenase (short-subunit alcohol dehydrogenase family)
MSSTAIPKGSTVLITGVNGYIASHVADQVIAAGYRVRGTVRSKTKGELMTEVYEKRHGPGKFESVVVPDMAVDHAFDDAVKGTHSKCPLTSLESVSRLSSDTQIRETLPPEDVIEPNTSRRLLGNRTRRDRS